MTSSVAKKAGSASTAGSNGTSSNGGSRENTCSNGMPSTEGRVCVTKLLCYRDGQEQ